MTPQTAVPAGEHVPTADQRVVTFTVPWAHYEVQLALRGEKSVPRIAYLDGALEIITPSRFHERIKSCLGHLIAAYALERGIEFSSYGSWTLKNAPKEAGVEPDDCFIIGTDQSKDVPDLAIEVIWTSGGIDKLEIYRRLGVGEIWLWQDGRLDVHLLQRDQYERATRSRLFPDLDLPWLCTLLDRPTTSQAIQALRDGLRT